MQPDLLKPRSKSVFLFGRNPELSSAELQAVLPSDINRTAIGYGCIVSLDEGNACRLADRLGGVVKVAVSIGESPVINPEDTAGMVMEVCKDRQITFGISTYGQTELTEGFAGEVKQHLRKLGISSRYVAGETSALSSVQYTTQHVTELIVTGQKGNYHWWKTIWVQDYGEWSRRDREKPSRNTKRGMLPPKIARMTVNIATGGLPKTVLDPFSGTGTIPMEAFLIGCRVHAADQDPIAVSETERNLHWTATSYGLPPDRYSVFRSDATHVSNHVPVQSLDAVVTEPYMGPVKLGDSGQQGSYDETSIQNILKGLTKLYIGCLREWFPLLTPGGIVVIALPKYEIRDRVYTVKKAVDSCERLGYSIESDPIEYSRPAATVCRQFYILRKPV